MAMVKSPLKSLLLTGFVTYMTTSSYSFAFAAETTAVERGAYVAVTGGCASCHTDVKKGGATLAGGPALKTPFGTFNVPNITPDKKTGIGSWSNDDFITAMTKGLSPSKEHYYPAFPYTSYTNMSRKDLLDLKAYLDSLPAVSNKVPDHDLKLPFRFRQLLFFWKALFFEQGDNRLIAGKSPSWNRGRYLVNGPSHCGECHTPRNFLGGLQQSARLAGNPKGPNGERIPSLIYSDRNKFSKWSVGDIRFGLETGMKPDGDFLGGSMGEVITNITSKLTQDDLKAITEYLMDNP